MRRWPEPVSRGLCATLIFLVTLSGLTPVSAQQPSVEQATFYGHTDCDAGTFGISVVPESTGTNCGTSAGTSYTWTMPEDPPIDVDLLLEEGADVPMTVWIGSNTHGGNVDVTSTITSGSVTVASATGTAQFAGAAGTTYVEVAMTGTALVAEVTEPLEWEIKVDGVFSSIFMRFEDGRWTQFTLPITGVIGGGGDSDNGSSAIYENLTAAPELELTFDNETATYVYNWTQVEALGAMAFDVNGTGNVSVTLVDGNGTVLAAQSVQGNGTIDIAGAAAGNWSLTLGLEAFTGTVALAFSAPGVVDDNGTTGTGTLPEGNQTAGDGEKSPAVAWPLLAVGLAFLAVWRRR